MEGAIGMTGNREETVVNRGHGFKTALSKPGNPTVWPNRAKTVGVPVQVFTKCRFAEPCGHVFETADGGGK